MTQLLCDSICVQSAGKRGQGPELRGRPDRPGASQKGCRRGARGKGWAGQSLGVGGAKSESRVGGASLPGSGRSEPAWKWAGRTCLEVGGANLPRAVLRWGRGCGLTRLLQAAGGLGLYPKGWGLTRSHEAAARWVQGGAGQGQGQGRDGPHLLSSQESACLTQQRHPYALTCHRG